jgi:hypothetical protein
MVEKDLSFKVFLKIIVPSFVKRLKMLKNLDKVSPTNKALAELFFGTCGSIAVIFILGYFDVPASLGGISFAFLPFILGAIGWSYWIWVSKNIDC